jgi:hypothetical protein
MKHLEVVVSHLIIRYHLTPQSHRDVQPEPVVIAALFGMCGVM